MGLPMSVVSIMGTSQSPRTETLSWALLVLASASDAEMEAKENVNASRTDRVGDSGRDFSRPGQ